jgi:uncharacterized alkaline shock family protein YloU
MKERIRPKGWIEVSPTAIATLAHEAVSHSYGIVGMVSKDLATGIANILSRESKRGVVVQVRDGEIFIDLYVIVEYGTRIVSVARSLMDAVKYSVERALGVSVAEVNVHVEGFRISNFD